MGRLSGRFALGFTAMTFIAALAIATLAVPALASNPDPYQISSDLLEQPFAPSHVLGTDHLGRDVLLRLAYGVRVSLLVGITAALMATILGGLVGAVAGFYGRIVDAGSMRIVELFQAMPAFILAAVIVALAGPGLLRMDFAWIRYVTGD
jgi:peptide/nickel transport system permease protein